MNEDYCEVIAPFRNSLFVKYSILYKVSSVFSWDIRVSCVTRYLNPIHKLALFFLAMCHNEVLLLTYIFRRETGSDQSLRR